MEFPANSIRPRASSDLHRRIAPALLRAAFPNTRSGELMARAARYMGRSEKTIQNWLDGTHDMKLEDAASLLPLIGLEAFIKIIRNKG